MSQGDIEIAVEAVRNVQADIEIDDRAGSTGTKILESECSGRRSSAELWK
jgi:hypothetical protein